MPVDALQVIISQRGLNIRNTDKKIWLGQYQHNRMALAQPLLHAQAACYGMGFLLCLPCCHRMPLAKSASTRSEARSAARAGSRRASVAMPTVSECAEVRYGNARLH